MEQPEAEKIDHKPKVKQPGCLRPWETPLLRRQSPARHNEQSRPTGSARSAIRGRPLDRSVTPEGKLVREMD